MPATTKKHTRHQGSLFHMKEHGRTADGKHGLYAGQVGGKDIGTVVAKNATDGRKKLLRIARQLLK